MCTESVPPCPEPCARRAFHPALDTGQSHPTIEHPSWCRHVPDDAPWTGPYTYLADAEPELLHESRDLRLDVGETYAWSLSAGLVQLFELERLDDTGPPRVRLTVVQNEVLGEAQAFLSAEEARAFARMLTTMARNLDDADRLRGAS